MVLILHIKHLLSKFDESTKLFIYQSHNVRIEFVLLAVKYERYIEIVGKELHNFIPLGVSWKCFFVDFNRISYCMKPKTTKHALLTVHAKGMEINTFCYQGQKSSSKIFFSVVLCCRYFIYIRNKILLGQ